MRNIIKVLESFVNQALNSSNQCLHRVAIQVQFLLKISQHSDKLMTWCQFLSTSLQLSCLKQTNSTIIILEKQISRWSIWFKCCHCKQLFNQKSDWLQMILYHTEKLLIISIKKLCFQTFSSVSLHHIVISTSARRIQLFSVWSKMLIVTDL